MRARRFLFGALGALGAMVVASGLAWGDNLLLKKVLTGPRLIDGSLINQIIDCLNGAAGCNYSGFVSLTTGQGQFTVWHSGGAAPVSGTTGTDVTAVSTLTYIAPVFVPVNTTITGISVLNGSSVTGATIVALANSKGVPIAAAQSVSTTASGTNDYQKIPFAAAYKANGPALYWIMVQTDKSNHIRTHLVGSFGTTSTTTVTLGTMPSFTPPTSFVTGNGPIADTY